MRIACLTKISNNKLAQKVADLESELILKKGLPHLFGLKHYHWSHDYIQSTNRMNFICAANQIGKSSANIRKCITWATTPALWPKLWPSRPNQFWYFYPSIKVCTEEFEEKWVKEWLPRDDFKNHPVYGWKADIQQKKIVSIRFNSGVTVYFRSYEQRVSNVQTSSVHALFADEEMPIEVYNEIIMRISSPTIAGYFHMVFTATLGQEFWREVIEEKGMRERFPTAFKRQVSMYDCLKYRDGSSSPWTIESIEEVKRKCQTEAEIKRRVFGKFVLDEGLKYESYRPSANYVPPFHIPDDWLYFSGVDIGSGGAVGHPAAITFVAVCPDFQRGVVYKGWRGDKILTTAGDIYQKYQQLKAHRAHVGEYYDWNSRDFKTLSDRLNGSFQPADKSVESGVGLLNVLFKNGMLVIFQDDELRKLDQELQSLRVDTSKTNAKDDFVDSLRYAVTKIPWDFSCLSTDPAIVAPIVTAEQYRRMPMRDRLALQLTDSEFQGSLDVYQDEFDDANTHMEYDW